MVKKSTPKTFKELANVVSRGAFVFKKALLASSITFSLSLNSFAQEHTDILNTIKETQIKANPDVYGIQFEQRDEDYTVDLPDIPEPIRKKVNDDFLPLFTESCDNIAYSGVIENQAIAILEDTKDFIEQVTDPIVNVSKFESGVFLYAFGKCLAKETKERFSASDSKTVGSGDNTLTVGTGQLTFIDEFIDALASVDQYFAARVGAQGSTTGSVGTTLNVDARTENTPSVASQTIMNMINDGWFDQTAECIYEEKEALLTKLHSLFERNYKVKTSIIQSINNVCNVSLRQQGDPSTWDEIFQMQADMMGKDKLGIQDLITEKTDPRSISDKFKREGYDACIDGFSASGGCMTKEQEEKLRVISQLTEYKEADYSPLKAYKITRPFFTDQGVMKPEYAASQVFANVLTKAVPQTCAETGCSAVSINSTLAPTAKFELDYRRMRDTYRIRPSTEVSGYLDDILYSVFQRSAFVELTPTVKLTDVILPLENPFDKELFAITPPENERVVVMKTLSGKALTITDKYSLNERERIALFYRKVVESLFLIEGRTEDLAAYKNANAVQEADFVNFATQIQKLAADNAEMGRIIGGNSLLANQAAYEQANREFGAIQIFAWNEILKVIFNTNVQPVIKYKTKVNLEYGITSAVKDLTIPLNFNHERDFLKVRRFFQGYEMKINQSDIINTLNIRGLDIEQTVSTNLTDSELSMMADQVSPDEILDYINRVQKKTNILNARLINFAE